MNKNFLNNNIRLGIFLLIAFLVLSVFSVNSASARDLMGGPSGFSDGRFYDLLYENPLVGGPHRDVIIENRWHMDRE